MLVEVDGEPPLILDMGTGFRALGEHLNAPLVAQGEALQANVLLTHLHYDHVLGLPFFAPMRDPRARVDVWGPAQTGSSLGAALAGMVKPPFFPVNMSDFGGDMRFHELDETSEFAIGAVKVRVRAIPHIGRTLGFRFEADGVSVVYISDHQAPLDQRSVDDNVLELCDGADLLIHDAQYTDEEFANLPHWGHSTPSYAVQVGTAAGVKRLHLFHHDPAHTDHDLDSMFDQARRRAGALGTPEVVAAFEGMTVDLKPV